jgi:hypothetical protein
MHPQYYDEGYVSHASQRSLLSLGPRGSFPLNVGTSQEYDAFQVWMDPL